MPKVHFLDTLWVKNFDEIALSGTVKEIEAILCFAIFGKNSKWPPFLRMGKFFSKLARLHSLYTLWVENFDEIALSRTVKEIEAIEIALSRTVKEIEAILFYFHFWQKIENSKWPPFLGRGKFFENSKEYAP